MISTASRVFLTGYMGAERNILKTRNKKAVLITATLATIENFKQNGKWQEATLWHLLLFSGKDAEIAEKLKPGQLIHLKGKFYPNLLKYSVAQTHQGIIINVIGMQILSSKPVRVCR